MGGGMMMSGGTTPAFTLEVSADLIGQDQAVNVNVYVDAADDLGAYEVSLEVAGGDAGSLELEDVLIDTNHEDYVFGTASVTKAVSLSGHKLGATLMDGGVVVAEPAYLGTFSYRASPDARGVFSVAVRPRPYSFINEPSGMPIPSETGEAAAIGCDVECFLDEHCADDGNDCTADACTDYECVYPNQPLGTSCDDGLWCTADDECDGQGNCAGTADTCPPPRLPNLICCCEAEQVCSDPWVPACLFPDCP